MASPTEAEVQTQFSNRVKILDEQRKWGHVNATNLLSLIDTDEQAVEGDYLSASLAGLEIIRRYNASVLAPATIRAALDPILLQYARAREFPETNPQDIITRLFDDFIANAKTVKTRAFSFGSPSAGGGNVGTGLMHRLTKDENNLDIENQTADDKLVRCISDRQSGAPLGQELFEIRGETRLKDDIQIAGSGLFAQIQALSPAITGKFFGNPSFDTFGGTVTSVTSFQDWSVNSGGFTNINFDGTNYYRTFETAGTPYALKFLTNERIYQLFSNKKAAFRPGVPVYCQVGWNRSVGSCDGTVTLRFGGKSKAVALAAQSGWQNLRIDVDDDLWMKNWNETAPDLEIELSGRTTGTLLLDDLVVGEMTPFDGAWYAIVGGATPFKRLDTFSFSDTETGSKIQAFLWRGYGRFLPHTGSPTWADPA